MKTRRLFFGIATDPGTQARIHAFVQPLRRQGAMPRARWSAPELYHITVRFLGETPEDKLVPLAACAQAAAQAARPFELRWTELGAFARSRVLWLGIAEDEGFSHLVNLQRRLTEALSQAGLAKPEPRPYRPHLTLAREVDALRLRQIAPDQRRFPVDAPPLTVTELVLFESVRTPAGLRYPRVAAWPLGPAAAP